MARPIPFESPHRDAKLELLHKLEQAPKEHAAALLEAYDLLQAMHERGWIDTARGFVGSGNQVLDIAVTGAMKETSIRAMRNMLVLFNMLGSIEPDTLKKFTNPVPPAVQLAAVDDKAIGIWRLMKGSIFNKDFRRGLAAMSQMLRGIGLGLNQPK